MPSDIERAAACLTPLERRVLVLSSADRFDNEAIARRLGISRRCAERLLARAILKFDRALEQVGGRAGESAEFTAPEVR